MRKSLIKRFMLAFGRGIWGEVADRTVESFVFVAGLLGILYRNHFSLKKAINWESFAIVVTALCALVVWHAFRSARAVSIEIAQEQRTYGFNTQPYRIRFPKTKLYGIAACLTAMAVTASALTWIYIPRTNAYCYIQVSFSPQVVNGRLAFPLSLVSSVDEPWDSVFVQIRKPSEEKWLFYEEVGTLRASGFMHLRQLFIPDFDQQYLVVVGTRNVTFFEYLILTKANGGLRQEIEVYNASTQEMLLDTAKE